MSTPRRKRCVDSRGHADDRLFRRDASQDSVLKIFSYTDSCDHRTKRWCSRGLHRQAVRSGSGRPSRTPHSGCRSRRAPQCSPDRQWRKHADVTRQQASQAAATAISTVRCESASVRCESASVRCESASVRSSSITRYGLAWRHQRDLRRR